MAKAPSKAPFAQQKTKGVKAPKGTPLKNVQAKMGKMSGQPKVGPKAGKGFKAGSIDELKAFRKGKYGIK